MAACDKRPRVAIDANAAPTARVATIFFEAQKTYRADMTARTCTDYAGVKRRSYRRLRARARPATRQIAAPDAAVRRAWTRMATTA